MMEQIREMGGELERWGCLASVCRPGWMLCPWGNLGPGHVPRPDMQKCVQQVTGVCVCVSGVSRGCVCVCVCLECVCVWSVSLTVDT